MKYYDLKVATKLIIVFVFIAAIQIGFSFLNVNSMNTFNKNIDGMYNKQFVPMTYLAESKTQFQELNNKWNEVYSAKKSEKLLGDTSELQQVVDELIDKYSSSDLTKEQKETLSILDSQWQTYKQTYDQSIVSIVDNKEDLNDILLNEILPQQSEIMETFNKLIDSEKANAKAAHTEADKLYSAAKLATIIVAIIIFGLSVGMGLIMARIISRPLGQVAGLVERVADGDLTETAPISTKDEVGMLAQSVNRMVLQLRETVHNILGAADNLAASSSQVSASTEEIASASTEQANAAQTMNELFRELSDAITSVANNTEQAAELSNETTRIAHDGEKVVHSSVEGAGIVSEQMAKLERDSNRIGEIISVIDDIADQTNLLALNAAIEAARAGDQGRGFAVVADEVRNLAERSGEATKQITDIIQEMQKNTVQSVEAVENGMEYTRKTGEAFEEIIRMVNETGNKVTEIASASEEQAAQSAEVLTFIESISAATEEAAASSEETASTAQALADLSEELNASVSKFKLN